VFLRAGLLLLVGVAFWAVNVVALRGQRGFTTEEVPVVRAPDDRD
jgi:hypothetical protein